MLQPFPIYSREFPQNPTFSVIQAQNNQFFPKKNSTQINLCIQVKLRKSTFPYRLAVYKRPYGVALVTPQTQVASIPKVQAWAIIVGAQVEANSVSVAKLASIRCVSVMAMSRVFSVLVMVVLLVAVPLAHAQSDADYEEFFAAKTVAKAPAAPTDGTVATQSTTPPAAPSCSRYVAKSGAQYSTVKSAVMSIPDGMTERCVIYIAAGVYEEHFFIESSKGPITLKGVNQITTVIQYGLNAEIAGSTSKSATVGVQSDKFIAMDITFANTNPPPAGGAVGQQAVAFLIEGDQAEFYRVAFLGAQDTLYDKYGRHYYKNCYIRGSIDFIFGAGDAYFDACALNSIAAPYSGSLTAQKKTTTNQLSGFVFNGCWVTGSGPIYLGRAWGRYSKVIFAYTDIAAPIIPAGWFNWNDPKRQKTVFYAQYKCTGVGANTAGRVNWTKDLSDSQAAQFLTWDYIDGSSWIGKN